ncbi:unnamed protein product [Vitrella brassicaformis CCMP3155]|uniref:Uncharacterized protein n=1 Tax=Vitrella brassicaformis (strain CCMP3155) TaxID=1169540 RepID=A0A0G4G5N3_VITBC|nr:unnamed protein product [Vitrella brassicaformis CCMP3155]|eukprot:CEM23779.1 unnamed protein product [Vitrella brassicaformis CCMP3155]
MTGCLTGPIVSWLIHREEQRREVAPKVFYDWSSAALSVDGPPAAASAASGKCHPSFGRPVHRVVTAMQLTSAAMQDVIETLKLTHVPSDFHGFLWSHAFLVQSLRQKTVEMRSRRRGQVVVHLPRPDETSATGLRHMGTSDLSHAFANQRSLRHAVSSRLKDGKASRDGSVAEWTADSDVQPTDSCQYSVVSPGIALHDLQANLAYVVDELVTREQLHQAALQKAGDTDLEKADTEVSQRHHTGGWKALYEAFKKAKRTLIKAGSPPGAIPEVLASLVPMVVDTPAATEDVPMSGMSSPASSTRSQQSDCQEALTPLSQLVWVDWHRLSSQDKDSAALSMSVEAVYDAVAAMDGTAANEDDDK